MLSPLTHYSHIEGKRSPVVTNTYVTHPLITLLIEIKFSKISPRKSGWSTTFWFVQNCRLLQKGVDLECPQGMLNQGKD